MSYTLIDYFKAFHTMKQTLNLSAGTQSTYFALLGEFNAARFPEHLSISDRELKALAGLKSVSSAHEAKRSLKNAKLIDFSKDGGVTVYMLCTEHLPNSNRTLTEHLPNTFENPNIRVRDKTEDVKTLDIPSFVHSACACAPDEWNAEIEETLSRLWFSNNGAPVTAELFSYFQALIAKHGLQWLEAMILEASASYGGQYRMSVKYFRSCVDRKLKGDESIVRNVANSGRGKVVALKRSYELPKRTGNEPWLNR